MGSPAARITDQTAHGGMVAVGTPRVMIGNLPASRIGDMHTCPMVTGVVPHVGGPIVFGAINVWSAGVPQARSGDPCICIGPPDFIARGHIKTLVGMSGAFGGGVGGLVALLLGGYLAGLRNFLGGYPRAVADPDDPNGYYTQYTKAISVRGTPEFQQTTIQNLDTISSTNSGREVIRRIDDSGHTATIRQTGNGNACDEFANPGGIERATVGGAKNTGSDSVVDFNPDRLVIGDGSEDWMTRPTDVGLFHELRHSADVAEGALDPGSTVIDGRETLNAEAQAVGLGPYVGTSGTENTYRDERGQPERTYY